MINLKITIMRSKLFFSLLIFTLLLSSCLIKSFNPYFHNKDVVFDEELIGSWESQDESEWEFTKFVTEKSLFKKGPGYEQYKVSYKEKEGSESNFITTLFELDGKRYL